MSSEIKEKCSNLVKLIDEGKEQLANEMEMRIKELNEGLEKLKVEREALEKEKEAMNAVNAVIGNADDIIEMNVGGRCFTTTRSTLTQVAGSLLANMFSGRWEGSLSRSSDGCVFIDLDPDCFAEILLQLRMKVLTNSKINWYALKGPAGREQHFSAMLNYLGFITRNIFVFGSCASDVIISENKRIVSNSKDGHAWAIGEDILCVGDSWGLMFSKCHWIFCGIIATDETLNSNSYSLSTANGWTCSSVYSSGKTMKGTNWKGFVEGDQVTMMLCESVLKMKVRRFPYNTFTIKIPINTKWLIHVNLYYTNDSIELVKPFDHFEDNSI